MSKYERFLRSFQVFLRLFILALKIFLKIKFILNMDLRNAIVPGDILQGILKNCVGSYVSILTIILNTSLERSFFPNQLKLLEMNPVFKKEDKLSKENNHLVSVLSHACKIFFFSIMMMFTRNKTTKNTCNSAPTTINPATISLDVLSRKNQNLKC